MDKDIQQSELDETHSGAKISRETESTLARAMTPVLIILVFSIIQGIRFGLGTSDYVWLFLGSIVSVIAMFTYGMVPILLARGSPKRGWMRLAALGGNLPYLFLLYIFFYRGLWSIASLFSGFSFIPVLKAIVFCGLGYRALKNFHKITEIAMATLRTA
jgi:hypothetical protein